MADKARAIAQELLVEVRKVLTEREATHGPVRPNLDRTAHLWSALIGKRLTAADVAVMLAMLKVARICEGNQFQRDHWADCLGYIALAGGLVLEGPSELAELRDMAANANRRDTIVAG